MTGAPVEHLEDSLKLESDAPIDLYEIHLKIVPTVVRVWNGVDRTWQGQLWEGMPVQIQGESAGTENQNARPKLTIINPSNIFGPFASEGYLDLATVIRKRVLQEHFKNDVNIYEQRVWIVGRPLSVSNQVLTLELRSPTDMPAWKTPRRAYTPPDFPFIVT